MKRRGFLGLLSSLAFLPKEEIQPPKTWLNPKATPTVPLKSEQIFAEGTCSASPRFTFSNDCDTGIYRTEANEIGIVVSNRRTDL